MTERYDRTGHIIISPEGASVEVTDLRANGDGRPRSLALTEQIGELTTDDGRKIIFLRAFSGSPVFFLRWAKDDAFSPGGEVRIDVTQAIYEAVALAEARAKG
jgi:hypothetical protein